MIGTTIWSDFSGPLTLEGFRRHMGGDPSGVSNQMVMARLEAVALRCFANCRELHIHSGCYQDHYAFSRALLSHVLRWSGGSDSVLFAEVSALRKEWEALVLRERETGSNGLFQMMEAAAALLSQRCDPNIDRASGQL